MVIPRALALAGTGDLEDNKYYPSLLHHLVTLLQVSKYRKYREILDTQLHYIRHGEDSVVGESL